jgi:nicotinate-nucleotide adenylyltransferase
MSENTSRQRIGLFGGTFDPIHMGHLLIAEAAREQLRLDQVRFIPAATAPHKLEQQATDGKQRLEMIRLAIGGHPQFTSDDRELRRGGTSYTVDTLAEIKQELPEAELFFLIGSDSLDELHTWREPRRICELAFLAVIARGGHPAPDLLKLREFLPESQHADLTGHLVTMPQMEISSRDIRKRLAQGHSVRYQLHPAVEAYIDAQQLYRQPA